MKEKKNPYGKKILMKLHPSRRSYLYVYAMIPIILGYIFFAYSSGLYLDKTMVYSSFLFCLFAIKFVEIHRLVNTYVITPEAIVHSHGLISTSIKRVYIQTLSDLILEQTPWQRMLNYGNVTVLRYTEGSAITVKNISNPVDFIELAQKKLKHHFPIED